jgi:hypothetical protein
LLLPDWFIVSKHVPVVAVIVYVPPDGPFETVQAPAAP